MQPTELSVQEIKAFMAKAYAKVDSEFVPEEHLPKKVYDWLQPIVNSSCQGYFQQLC